MSEMYLPLCDICKHQNRGLIRVKLNTGEKKEFICSEGDRCPGFEMRKVEE